jgi:formamidopyrimidine-DNA glycosylase
MVEGPKVVLKCERLAKSLVNRILLQSSDPALASVEGKACERVISVGKELFIVFENNLSIRLHFQMNGSERLVPSGSPPPDLDSKSRKVLTAKFSFDSIELYLYDTTVSIRASEYLHIVQQRVNRDICNPRISFSEVVEMMIVDQRPLKDLIMDQIILPGVGNIIKCEGLFLSRIHPNACAASLGIDELTMLVVMLHRFSLSWMDNCRRGRPTEYSIYGRDSCIECLMPVSLVRDGDLGRITYFCARCQVDAMNTFKDSSSLKRDEPLSDAVDLFIRKSCKCKTMSKLQRVRKVGMNMNRLFWSCGGLRYKGCGFFEWADATFPKCLHGRVSILRRVLKPGANNGRYFFCCGEEKNEQCKYFNWIDSVKDQSSSIQHLKRPLPDSENELNVTTATSNKCIKTSFETCFRISLNQFSVPL